MHPMLLLTLYTAVRYHTHTHPVCPNARSGRLYGTVAHLIFFPEYCEPAVIITQHPSLKVISLRYTKAETSNL